MRPCFLLVFCFLLRCPVYAQRTVGGRVTNAAKEPVPFATVLLQNTADSSILATELTDTGGRYRILTADTGRLFLRIVAPGYRILRLPVADAPGAALTLDIALTAEGHTLGGVMVSAAKPLVERRADRTIFNVENSAASVGGDALEALKRAPGVRVTDKQVSIAGKSTVNVLLNDRLVQVSGDELVNLLRSIPADNLSRIEVITTPPAKYDAAGNAGLINIVTKKQLSNGLNGSVTPGYTQRTSAGYGVNGSFNYRRNRLNVFGVGNAFHFSIKPDEQLTTYYTDQTWQQESGGTRTNVFNRVQLGADYSLNDRMILGGLYTIGNGGSEFYADQLVSSRVLDARTGALDSVIRTRATSSDRGFRNVLNLNYEWKIDTAGRKLTVDADYFRRMGRMGRGFFTRSYLPDDLPAGDGVTNRSSGSQLINIRSLKADVAWPSRLAELSFGAKVSFIRNNSDNLFQFLDDTVFHTDPLKTNTFDYRENTQAAYLSAQRTFGKWQLQAGLRAEYTQTRGYSATLSQANTNDYFKLFPTAYVQYAPAEDHSLTLNYSRRIERPDFWQMNPFRSYVTANSYEQGNPFLQPSFSHNVELSYLLRSKYSFTLYAQSVSNLSTRLSYVDSVNKFYYFTTGNAGSVRSCGASVNLTLSPAKWWECVLSGNAWYSSFRSEYYGGGVSYSRPAFTAETGQTFFCNKSRTLVAELNLQYSGSQLSDFDLQRSTCVLYAGMKALFLQKRLIFAVSGNDLLRGDRSIFENQYNGTRQNNYYDGRSFRFACTWKFGNSQLRKLRERNAGADDAGRAR